MVSRTSIEEANKHLQALYSRVNQLENTVKQQQKMLADKDEHAKEELQELAEVKDAEITELTANLICAKEKLKTLATALKEKDKMVAKLQERSVILERVMEYQPTLESLLTTLASGTGCLSDSGISASEMPAEDHPYRGGKACVYRGSAIRRMAKNFNSHVGRRKQFSISEDDDEDQNADTEGETSDEKSCQDNRELYL